MFICIGYCDYIVIGRILNRDVYAFMEDTGTAIVLFDTDNFLTLNTKLLIAAVRVISNPSKVGLGRQARPCLTQLKTGTETLGL